MSSTGELLGVQHRCPELLHEPFEHRVLALQRALRPDRRSLVRRDMAPSVRRAVGRGLAWRRPSAR